MNRVGAFAPALSIWPHLRVIDVMAFRFETAHERWQWHMAADDKDLASTVQDILNKTFCLYMTASKYHWNVKGTDFPQYHEFFGEIYEDAQGAIDHLAEMILMLGGTADLNPDKVGKSVTPSDMIRDLLKKSEVLIEDLTKAVDEATEAEEHAVANDLAERLGAHQKWAWQLKSTK